MPYLSYHNFIDTGWQKIPDTVFKKATKFEELLPDSARQRVLDQSISYVSSIKNSLQLAAAEYEQ